MECKTIKLTAVASKAVARGWGWDKWGNDKQEIQILFMQDK